VDHVPETLLLRQSGSAWNRTRASGSVAKNSARTEHRSEFQLLVLGWGETLHSVGRAPFGLVYQCGAIGLMRIGRGNGNLPECDFTHKFIT
jgi:hypothetical protein